ncbi:MAG: carboxylating nicotinate-nucleotide diphosphorylase [candidate division WOR-3 bacterium]
MTVGFRPPATQTVRRLVRDALAEDLGPGDVTSRMIVPAQQNARARLVARGSGVLCGIDICRQVFSAVDQTVRFRPRLRDGRAFQPGTVLAEVQGRARSLLAAERTALNFLQRLSGIATLTRRYVVAVQGTGATILDTRKTTPGWRELEKYAVRCGGGVNHRMGLYDMVLIKDNHIAVAGSVRSALAACRQTRLEVEVEVTSIAQVKEALAAGARRLLLDNMTLAQLRRAVQLCRGRARTEASGGVRLQRVRKIAETGVDSISVGAITHSAPASDIALEFIRDRRF